MSIIEKAVGKRDHSQGAVEIQPESTAPVAAAPSVPLQEPAPEADEVPGSALFHAEHVQPSALAEKRTSRKIDINLARLHEIGMITPEGGRTPVAEEFRMIKRPLIDKAFARDGRPVNHPNLIMVTSALPGEGKTFCAINLAMSMAMEMDHTVMLVDADVARPSVLRSLGVTESSRGLMEVLNEEVDPADVLLKTNIDGLSILPAGQSHRHATELLASQGMNRFLHEIAKRYSDRLVIFDSPPLLLTTEARALASQMGQIVLVVEAESTTQHAVKEAVQHLGSNPNVNLVYNKSRAFAGGGYSGGYYG